jgi:DNA repair protein RadC
MNRYALRETDLVLDEHIPTVPAIKEYILKVRDLPTEEKPREKLLQSGPSALTTPELMAIILSSGTKKEDVMSMANRVIHDYGQLSLANSTNPLHLSQELDIPLIKAMQIVACAELGRRFFQKRTGAPAIIRSSADVFEYLRPMGNLPKEHLRGLYLNMHYQIIHDEVLSIGTIASNLIHPREVFKPALEYNAAAVILAHNHPSQVATPSEADIAVTRQLIAAGKLIGITLIDHVIVTKETFTSIPERYE